MLISKHAFVLKYHTKTPALIAAARLDYATQYGYDWQALSSDDMNTLEHLDSIECLINETKSRIDAVIDDPIFCTSKTWSKSSIERREERLVPLLCLMDRLQLQVSFAKAKLLQYVTHSVTCIANWAQSLIAMCQEVQGVYSRRATALRAAMATQLEVYC